MILIKILLTATLWTMGWAGYFATVGAPPTILNFAIVFLPFILMYFYFMIFVWDD